MSHEFDSCNNMNADTVRLVQLYSDLQPPDSEPFACEVLAGAVTNAFPMVDCSVHLVDDRFEERHSQNISDLLNERPPSVLGVSMPQGTLQIAKSFLSKLDKEKMTNTKIVLGGPIPSWSEEPKLSDELDVERVKGWGEEPFIKIIQKHIGKVALPNDLGAIPVRLDVSNNSAFPRRIETSRGCSYGVCSFCTRPNGKSRPDWSEFSINSIRLQLNELEEMGVHTFEIVDEDFIGKRPERLVEINDLLSNYNFSFSSSMRVESITPSNEHVKSNIEHELNRLARNGLSLVYMGVESFSKEQLIRYRKHIGNNGVKRCKDAINALEKAGVDIEMGIIMFDPGVTKNDVLETTKVLLEEDMYKYIDHPFSRLRLQAGSVMASEYQTTGFDDDTLEYKWDFEHKESSDIFEKCDMWWKDIYPAYKEASSIYRALDGSNSFRLLIHKNIVRIRKSCVKVLQASTSDNAVFVKTASCEKKNVVEALTSILDSTKGSCFANQLVVSLLEEKLPVASVN